MTESPDSMAYTAGLYIGENIRLYYRPGEETDRPVCVLTVKLREDDANGPVLCDLLSYKEFDLKSMENFCLRRYNLIRTDGNFRQWWRIFFPEVSERRISPACSGKGSWPTDSRNPLSGRNWTSLQSGYAMKRGMPQSSSGIRNKEVSGGSPVSSPQSVTNPCTAPLTEGTYTGYRPSVSRSPAHRPHTGSCGHCRRTRP